MILANAERIAELRLQAGRLESRQGELERWTGAQEHQRALVRQQIFGQLDTIRDRVTVLERITQDHGFRLGRKREQIEESKLTEADIQKRLQAIEHITTIQKRLEIFVPLMMLIAAIVAKSINLELPGAIK